MWSGSDDGKASLSEKGFGFLVRNFGDFRWVFLVDLVRALAERKRWLPSELEAEVGAVRGFGGKGCRCRDRVTEGRASMTLSFFTGEIRNTNRNIILSNSQLNNIMEKFEISIEKQYLLFLKILLKFWP